MRGIAVLMGAALLAGMLLAAGCGKKVREAAEVARVAQDAQDGSFTVKGEDGQEVKVETDQTGAESGKWTISSDKGTMTGEVGEGKVTEEDIGIAFYPGAEVGTGAKVSSEGQDTGNVRSVELLTDDPVDKVAQFYKDKYGQGSQVVEQEGQTMITMGGQGTHKLIMVMKDEESGKTKIAIQVIEGM
ncbi:MAG: hypothetical protein HPY69_13425 [Armatimonadetes bacterium]|nr:hypothetical protein [Armatimonadota bacterium]